MRSPLISDDFREVGRRGRQVFRWQVAADLIYGQVKKSYRRRKLVRVTHVMRLGTEAARKRLLTGDGLFWTAEYRFYRTGESDRPLWGGSSGTPHLGYRTAVSTAARQSRVVASLLPFCASTRSVAGEARAATRAGGQPSGATLPATDSCDGSWQNPSTMDNSGGAFVPFAAGFRLRGSQARWGAVSCRGQMGEGTRRRARREPHSRVKWPVGTVS